LIKFIDNNISALIKETPEKLCQFITFLQTNILLLNKETIAELRIFSKDLDSKISQTYISHLPSYFHHQNLFIPISFLSDWDNFESSYDFTSFNGGDFGGAGAGDSW
jgi:hypothetical protein